MGSVRIAVQHIIGLTDDLDLLRSQLYKITLWAISRFLLDKLSPNFNTLSSLGRGLSNNQKHPERFERETYANALRWPPLCKKMSLTITFELRHLGWWFWHLDICFQGQGIWWCHLFWPVTLTFRGHDLCEITFWAISQLLMGKMLPNFNTR